LLKQLQDAYFTYEDLHRRKTTLDTKITMVTLVMVTRFSMVLVLLVLLLPCVGDRGSTVVKVLCYKSEGRWFDPSWCQWIFH